jgi:hypothetical protein
VIRSNWGKRWILGFVEERIWENLDSLKMNLEEIFRLDYELISVNVYALSTGSNNSLYIESSSTFPGAEISKHIRNLLQP